MFSWKLISGLTKDTSKKTLLDDLKFRANTDGVDSKSPRLEDTPAVNFVTFNL